VWGFTYEAIEECLRKRPWLVDFRKMERSFFRSIVKDAWDEDPWFTSEEAAPKLGLIDPNAIKRYIRRGWLSAERKPTSGAWQGMWIVRQSAIDAFLEDDPRHEYKHLSLVRSRHLNSYKNHFPIALQKIWVIKCPVCKHKTTIKANPHIAGPELKSLFLEIYTNGTCSHGKVCEIQRREVKT
jgi:hypothetical protein